MSNTSVNGDLIVNPRIFNNNKMHLTAASVDSVNANDSFFEALSDEDKLRIAKLFSKKILAQALMEVDNAD